MTSRYISEFMTPVSLTRHAKMAKTSHISVPSNTHVNSNLP